MTVKEASLNVDIAPPTAINDQLAAEYVRTTVEGAFSGTDSIALAYAPENVPGLRELSVVSDGFTSVAQNVSIVPKAPASTNESARTERIISVKQTAPIGDVLAKNGFTEQMVAAIERTMRSVNPSTEVREGFRMRILFGLESDTETQIPYLLSLYNGDERHLVTVARTDQGRYVLGAPPPGIDLPDEDTEEINVANLPSLYRSIYETGRKLDLKDGTIERIVAMFAYDLDLTKKISPGDQIQMLQTEPDADGDKELLYIGLQLAGTERHMYRFQTEDGVVDFFDENGQTGKKILDAASTGWRRASAVKLWLPYPPNFQDAQTPHWRRPCRPNRHPNLRWRRRGGEAGTMGFGLWPLCRIEPRQRLPNRLCPT